MVRRLIKVVCGAPPLFAHTSPCAIYNCCVVELLSLRAETLLTSAACVRSGYDEGRRGGGGAWNSDAYTLAYTHATRSNEGDDARMTVVMGLISNDYDDCDYNDGNDDDYDVVVKMMWCDNNFFFYEFTCSKAG